MVVCGSLRYFNAPAYRGSVKISEILPSSLYVLQDY